MLVLIKGEESGEPSLSGNEKWRSFSNYLEEIGGHESDILSVPNILRWLNFTSSRIKFSNPNEIHLSLCNQMIITGRLKCPSGMTVFDNKIKLRLIRKGSAHPPFRLVLLPCWLPPPLRISLLSIRSWAIIRLEFGQSKCQN